MVFFYLKSATIKRGPSPPSARTTTCSPTLHAARARCSNAFLHVAHYMRYVVRRGKTNGYRDVPAIQASPTRPLPRGQHP